MLDLSDLKKIAIADDGGSIKMDAGVTVAQLVSTLSNLKPGQQRLGELFAVLPSDSKLTVVEAVIDAALDPESRGREYARLSKAVEALHVVGKDGAITSKSLSNYNEDTDIVVSVILALTTKMMTSVQKPAVRKESQPLRYRSLRVPLPSLPLHGRYSRAGTRGSPRRRPSRSGSSMTSTMPRTSWSSSTAGPI